MLNYFKRVGGPAGDSQGASPKRPRSQVPVVSADSPKGKGATKPSSGGDPKTILTWNANGLGVRLGKDWQEFKDFLLRVKPDLCCIQEVRCTHPFCLLSEM